MAKKLWIENIDSPAVLWQEATPSGDWLDKTNDAIAWDLYGERVMDYLFSRDKINNILIPKANPNYPTIDFSGWMSGMTADERKVMAKHVLAPYALRLTQYSDADDKQNWKTLLRITQGTEFKEDLYTGRARLVELMRQHVADKVRIENLTMAQTQSFLQDVFQLIEWYTRSADPSFKLWLYSQAPYDTTGFNSKSYWSTALEAELFQIYETGEPI